MILGRRAYRQHLPHYQQDGRAYFVTFVTHRRWTLPPSARAKVLEHVLIEHQWRAYVHTVVVMPDHVHIVLTPLANEEGETHALTEISKGIKGSSARAVNQVLSRTGTVWQKESFDHEVRRDESVRSKCEYVAQNPVRKHLCRIVDDYPWLWREWIEGRPG